MVLLDRIPHTAYGRMKPCRTVLADHMIPSYVASLASAMENLPAPLADAVAAELSGEVRALEREAENAGRVEDDLCDMEE